MKVAQKIAIRNAIAKRAAVNRATVNRADRPIPQSGRLPSFDLERIISGEASRSTMKRYLASVEGMDGDLMSVEQSRAAQSAEDALAPKPRYTGSFRATFGFTSVESKFTAGEKRVNYLVMRGCEVTIPSGETVNRTVMAFDTAFERVSRQVLSGQDIDVDVVFAGSVLKVVEDDALDTAAASLCA